MLNIKSLLIKDIRKRRERNNQETRNLFYGKITGPSSSRKRLRSGKSKKQASTLVLKN